MSGKPQLHRVENHQENVMSKILSELTIEVVQKCANTCLFCSSLSGKFSKHQITIENVINVGTQAVELGLKNISISGGEPLLHPDIKTMVSVLNSLGLDVTIYTTGIVLDGNDHSVVFKDWSGFDKESVRLIFGLQSSSANIHDEITQNQGSFSSTKEAMLCAHGQGFSVEIHVVPNKINLSSIEKSVEDFLDWGIERVSFLRLVAQGYARKNKGKLLLDENENERLKNIFAILSNKYDGHNKVRLGIPFSGLVESPRPCNAGDSKLIIRYDGKVLPCEAFKDECFNNFILGDIRNDLLKDMLNSASSNYDLISLKSLITPIETCPAQLLYS